MSETQPEVAFVVFRHAAHVVFREKRVEDFVVRRFTTFGRCLDAAAHLIDKITAAEILPGLAFYEEFVASRAIDTIGKID